MYFNMFLRSVCKQKWIIKNLQKITSLSSCLGPYAIVNKQFYALSNKSQEKQLIYPQLSLTVYSFYGYQSLYDFQKSAP